MKRITFWLLSTLSAVVLLFGYSTSTSGPLATSETTSVQSGTYSASTTASTGSSSTTSAASDTSGATSGSTSSSSSSTSSTSSKTITGDVVQTRWGPVQVQITVASGKITKVTVLQYPTGNGKDEEINSYALPILTKETVDAQSSQIDMVSGATFTSDGYIQSLQSALDQAGL